jgi:hypothetical protein
MSRSSTHRHGQPTKDRDSIIRYHLEEASTHIGALKQMVPYEEHHILLSRMSKALVRIYNRYAPPELKQ